MSWHGVWCRRGAALLLAAAALLALRAQLSPLLLRPIVPGNIAPGLIVPGKILPTPTHRYHAPKGTAPPIPSAQIQLQTQSSSTVKPVPSPINITSSSTPKSSSSNPSLPLAEDLYEAGHEWPHPELCPKLGAQIKILILVTSAPSHSQARQAVRLTWGHYASRSDVALAFVIGSPPSALKPALQEEDSLYGDIILGRFVDSYSNLTLKTLSMLEWADTYCPRARHVLKTDDDMFINVPLLLQFASAPGRANATKTIWGKLLRKSLPKRVPKSKYYLSTAQFPGRVLPEFCSGPAYLVTGDCVRPLYETALKTKYLPLEDVFITGVVGKLLNIRRIHSPQFYNKRVSPHPCAIQRGVAVHMVRYHEQFDLWRKLLDGKTKCAS